MRRKIEQNCDLKSFTVNNLMLEIEDFLKQPTFDLGSLAVNDLMLVIGSFLKPSARNVLAMTSKANFALFKPNFKKEMVHKLLIYIGCGNQDVAQDLLIRSPELMTERTGFADCSGRFFPNISAFEFMLWSLDTRYMGRMMLECLPKNDVGLNTAKLLLQQYEHFNAHGITYFLKGKTITEKHFDFSKLINALQTYNHNFGEWSEELDTYLNRAEDWTEEAQESYWCTVVGREQFYIPAHVMQHYFDPNVDFEPTPTFKASEFQRDEDVKYVYIANGRIYAENLGINCGMIREAQEPRDIFENVSGDGGWENWDIDALITLCKVRTYDVRKLKFKLENFCHELEEPITLNKFQA
jgi:hypothetical protein